MSEIIVSKVLPPELAITGADSHLYRIGVSMQRTTSVQRKIYYKPIVVFIILFEQLVRNLIFIALPEQNTWFYAVLGDFGHFMGVRQATNIVVALIMVQIISCQLIFFRNYMKSLNPIDLRVFEVMSGLMPPNSIGLDDKQIVMKLRKVFNRYINIANYYSKLISIQTFLVVFFSYYIKLSRRYFIIYGIPHTILTMIVA